MRYGLLLLGLMMTPCILRAQAPVETPADTSLQSVRAFVRISDRLATSGQVALNHIGSIKAAGYDVVINLAPASEKMNRDEGFGVVSSGLSYVHIPVDFKNPQLRDLEFFFQVMNANRDRKVYVHCFANMRASSFMYLYRVIHEGIAPEEAKKALNQVWEPNEDWANFIDRALTAYGKR